nr:cyclin-a1-1 [Quercus suber]
MMAINVPKGSDALSLILGIAAATGLAVVPASCSMDVSPSKSDGLSISLDETMSTCESYKSAEVEYIDNNDLPAVDSINEKTLSNLYISNHEEKTGNICNRDFLAKMETDDKIVNVDNNYMDSCITSFPGSNETAPSTAVVPASCSMDVSPSKSDGLSISLDETMSTCESYKSAEVEYIDNNDLPAVDSINEKTLSNLYISNHEEKTGNICNRDFLAKMETDDKIVNVDNNYMDSCNLLPGLSGVHETTKTGFSKQKHRVGHLLLKLPLDDIELDSMIVVVSEELSLW